MQSATTHPTPRTSQPSSADVLRELRSWDVDIHATMNGDFNTVHIAASEGHLAIMRQLRSWDVDIHATNNLGSNAAHVAAGKGQLEVLRELQRWEVNIHATLNDGRNAVHLAAKYGQLDELTQLKCTRNVRPSSPPRRSISAQRDAGVEGLGSRHRCHHQQRN